MFNIQRFVTVASLGLASLSSLIHAAPHQLPTISKRQASGALTDMDILQFALTLEHLETAFYQQGFAKFPDSDFMALGLSMPQLMALKSVAMQEATHVTTLMSVIMGAGGVPVQPCTYNFGFTDAATMVKTAKILEVVGVSAYLGAAPLVSDKALLSAAASIVTVESRHQTFIRAALQEAPIPQAFDTPVDPRSIFTIASAFVSSCPAGSALAITPFPSLVILNADKVTPGSTLTLADPALPNAAFCAFTAGGVGTLFTPFNNGACMVPADIAGEVYVQVTSKGDGKAIDDSTVIAGPAVLQIS